MSKSAHTANSKITMRTQKALGTEFLIFFETNNKRIFFVDFNSLNTDPSDRDSVNREINDKKQLLNVPITHPIDLTDTAGNDNVLSIAWTHEVQSGSLHHVTLVAVTRQNDGFNQVVCPNGSHDIQTDGLEEIKIIIKNNEPKILDIHTQGQNYILEAFGH